jgi:hypothetical protein
MERKWRKSTNQGLATKKWLVGAADETRAIDYRRPTTD